ncbi:MAG TPA: PD-(D/E)XK nuclease family protein, partial [Thermoleophilia bacterium]|nr:PD-(D/E)XK nuclease family protein [Thermoleophilia bacterium]
MSGRFPELEAALVERVRELRAGRPLVSLTVVVGSSAVRTRVGDVLVRCLGAVANVSVLTLGQFARRLATEARGAPLVQLAGLTRERLLRRLVSERAAGGFAYFGPVADRPHFPLALASTFADLRQALVEPETPWARAGLGPQGPAEKVADLEALYAAYCAELDRGGLADDAQVHTQAAQRVRVVASRAPHGVVHGALAAAAPPPVVIYGIYDLNSAQEELVGALLAAGADAFVPMPRGGRDAVTPTSDEAVVTSASDGAASEGVLALASGRSPFRIAPPESSRDVDQLSAVWRSPGSGATALAPLAGDGSLTVLSVPDERGEGREAVRAIVEAVSAGAGAWECAVVVPHREDAERVAEALAAAGLPVACRLPDRSPGPRVLARLADCLAPPAGPPFARRAVLDLLGAAQLLWDVPAGEAARWLDEARRAGVVAGLDQWVERTARRRGGLERTIAAAAAAGEEVRQTEDDDDESERLDLLRGNLAAARSLETALAALARACDALPARARWAEWARALGRALDVVFAAEVATVARDAGARLGVLDVLEEEVDALTMAAALREQVAGGTVQAGRVGRDGVAVLTPLEMRGLSFHTVVFTGLADGGFPARGRPDPLFGDGARTRLRDQTGARLPLAEERSAESLLLFAFSCEAARENLTLIAPRTDAASGRPRLPSRVLMHLASLAAGGTVGLDDFLTGAPLAPVWRHIGGAVDYAEGRDTVWVDAAERDTAALLALSGSAGSAGAQPYLAAVLADEAAARRRAEMWRAARHSEPGAWDGLLGADARAALTARHPFDAEMHPTRLERYVSCPFAFLLRDIFGLEAPDEPGESLEMEPREFGTLAHDILQRAFDQLIVAWPETGRGPDAAAAQAAVESAW